MSSKAKIRWLWVAAAMIIVSFSIIYPVLAFYGSGVIIMFAVLAACLEITSLIWVWSLIDIEKFKQKIDKEKSMKKINEMIAVSPEVKSYDPSPEIDNLRNTILWPNVFLERYHVYHRNSDAYVREEDFEKLLDKFDGLGKKFKESQEITFTPEIVAQYIADNDLKVEQKDGSIRIYKETPKFEIDVRITKGESNEK